MTLSNASGLGPPHRDCQTWFNFAEVKCIRLQVVNICSDWLWVLIKKPFRSGDPFAAPCGPAGSLLWDGPVGEEPSATLRSSWWRCCLPKANIPPGSAAGRPGGHSSPARDPPCPQPRAPNGPGVLGWFRPNTHDSWSFGKNFSKE